MNSSNVFTICKRVCKLEYESCKNNTQHQNTHTNEYQKDYCFDKIVNCYIDCQKVYNKLILNKQHFIDLEET